jgi:cardiolipin synthase
MGQQLQLLHTGAQFFSVLINDIRASQQSICLETYVFSGDLTAKSILDELLKAADRGVRVQIIADWVGTKGYGGIELLKSASGRLEVRFYNEGWIGSRGISRDHRKIIVIDDKVCFVGGINILDDLYGKSFKLNEPRWDFAVRMAGDVVQVVENSFKNHWRLLSYPYGLDNGFFRREDRSAKAVDEGKVSFISRDNLRNRFQIEGAYLRAIKTAKQNICLASPYFVPGRRLRKALINAAKRGVNVRILLGKKEFFLLDRVTHHLYSQFLKAGVVVAEYNRSWLHAKVGVADDDWLTIGSSNLDALSFFINHEANVVIRSHAVVVQMQTYFDEAFYQFSHVVKHEDVVRKKIKDRLFDWFCYVFYRLIMKLLTSGRYD